MTRIGNFAGVSIDINLTSMSTGTLMKTTRSYTMGARARSVEETRTRILGAAFELFQTRPVAEISLDQVAERAGVSVQTVLRRFGSRAGLVEATAAFGTATVTEERRAPIGDVAAALRVVVDHYELRGPAALLMLAQETVDDDLARMAREGKQLHRAWVQEVFGPLLPPDDDSWVDLLVVATDVYTWKLLRLDRELSRSRTESRMRALVEAVLAAAAPLPGRD